MIVDLSGPFLYRSRVRATAVLFVACAAMLSGVAAPASEIVTFPSGSLMLHGVLFKPQGTGPFPAVVYNHGSAAGMLSQEAFDALGPVFVRQHWILFGPYRRGQGLSAEAGGYIGDEIDAAKKQGGVAAGGAQRIESPEPRLQRPARERRRVVAADESVMGEGLTVALTASYIEVGAEGARARARRVDGDGVGCAGRPEDGTARARAPKQ